jgi:hypothetical protein
MRLCGGFDVVGEDFQEVVVVFLQRLQCLLLLSSKVFLSRFIECVVIETLIEIYALI